MSFSNNTSSSSGGGAAEQQSNKLFMNKNKFKGIRRRKWGKWVSEIRVPGTPNRLWLGSYSTAEAAAAAHDVASFYLRSASSSSSSSSSVEGLNFPEMLMRSGRAEDGVSLSPRSVQKAASDAGMAVDAAHRVFMQQSSGTTNNEISGSHSHGRDPVESTRDENWSFRGSWMVGDNNGGKCKADDLNISVDDYL